MKIKLGKLRSLKKQRAIEKNKNIKPKIEKSDSELLTAELENRRKNPKNDGNTKKTKNIQASKKTKNAPKNLKKIQKRRKITKMTKNRQKHTKKPISLSKNLQKKAKN